MTSQFALPHDGSAASVYGFTPGTTAAMLTLQAAAPSSLVAGRSLYWNTDWTALMVWNGTRFIPTTPDRRVRVSYNTTTVGQTAQPGNTTAAALAGTLYTFLPGLVKAGDKIGFYSMLAKLGGVVETATCHLRIGGANTASDQSFSGAGMSLATTGITTTQTREFRVESNTTLRILGCGGYTAVNPLASASATAQPAADTVNGSGNFASANVYMQWWSAMSVGTGGEYVAVPQHEVYLTMG